MKQKWRQRERQNVPRAERITGIVFLALPDTMGEWLA